MTSKLILITPLFLLFVIGAMRLNLSPQRELQKIKKENIHESKINMDECWPFPRTLSVSDPNVFELKIELDKSREKS